MEERPAPSDGREHARVLMAQARHGSFMQTHDDDGAQAEQLSDAGHDCHHTPCNLLQENHKVKASLQAILDDKAGAAKGFDGGRSEEAEAPTSETSLCTHVDACKDTSSNHLNGGCIEGGEASADVASEPHGTLQQHSWRCLVTVFLAALGELDNLLQLDQHVRAAYPDSLAQQAPRSHLLERLKRTFAQLQQLGRRLATHAMHSTVEAAHKQLPAQSELLKQLVSAVLAHGSGLLDQMHAYFPSLDFYTSTIDQVGCQLERKLEVLTGLHERMRQVAAHASTAATTITIIPIPAKQQQQQPDALHTPHTTDITTTIAVPISATQQQQQPGAVHKPHTPTIPNPATQQQEPPDVLLATHAAYSTARPLLTAQQMGMISATQPQLGFKPPPVKVAPLITPPPPTLQAMQQPTQQQQPQQAQTPVPGPAPFFHPSSRAACAGTAALLPVLTPCMLTSTQPLTSCPPQQPQQQPRRPRQPRPSTTRLPPGAGLQKKKASKQRKPQGTAAPCAEATFTAALEAIRRRLGWTDSSLARDWNRDLQRNPRKLLASLSVLYLELGDAEREAFVRASNQADFTARPPPPGSKNADHISNGSGYQQWEAAKLQARLLALLVQFSKLYRQGSLMLPAGTPLVFSMDEAVKLLESEQNKALGKNVLMEEWKPRVKKQPGWHDTLVGKALNVAHLGKNYEDQEYKHALERFAAGGQVDESYLQHRALEHLSIYCKGRQMPGVRPPNKTSDDESEEEQQEQRPKRNKRQRR